MISSTSNTKVKYVHRLQRDRRFRYLENTYVVEGSRWLTELAQFSIDPKLILATKEWLQEPDNANLCSSLGAPLLTVSSNVMAHASDAKTPQGILAVVPMVSNVLPVQPTMVLILDRIANPGNLGTILRTAAAAAVDAVLLAPGSVDIYNPKVLRGAMGAHLRLPIAAAGWKEIKKLTKDLTIWLADAATGKPYYEVDWQRETALIVGSEASGPGSLAISLAHERVTIPMEQETESINAAVATGILLFEALKQRRFKQGKAG